MFSYSKVYMCKTEKVTVLKVWLGTVKTNIKWSKGMSVAPNGASEKERKEDNLRSIGPNISVSEKNSNISHLKHIDVKAKEHRKRRGCQKKKKM
jgi:hypothetical protein